MFTEVVMQLSTQDLNELPVPFPSACMTTINFGAVLCIQNHDNVLMLQCNVICVVG